MLWGRVLKNGIFVVFEFIFLIQILSSPAQGFLLPSPDYSAYGMSEVIRLPIYGNNFSTIIQDSRFQYC